MTFHFSTPAELFKAKRKGGARQPLGYRRFTTAAEAIRFAVEDFPATRAFLGKVESGFPSENARQREMLASGAFDPKAA
jgi:hypothetical protein